MGDKYPTGLEVEHTPGTGVMLLWRHRPSKPGIEHKTLEEVIYISEERLFGLARDWMREEVQSG